MHAPGAPEQQVVERGNPSMIRLRDAVMAKRAPERAVERDLGIPQDADIEMVA